MRVTVKIYEGDREILNKVLGEGVYRAGRSDFSDVVLPHDSVSRSHLELRVTESAVYMTNMSTAGKIKHNGKPMETGEIADGDELSVGPYRIVIFFGERDGVQEPAPMPLAAEMPFGASDPEPAGMSDNGPSDGFGDNGNDNFFGENNPGAENNAPVPSPLAEASPPEVPNYMPEEAPQSSAPIAMLGSESPLPVEGTQALARAETQVEIKPVVAKLIFSEGPRAGDELFLEAYEVTLGRSKRADIFLDDEKLSRVHAKITRVGMGYRLIDLSSRNGTYVNGMRVLEHPLNSFDEIQIGNSKIKFLIHDVIANEVQKGALTLAGGQNPVEQTKSYQMDPNEAAQLQLQLQEPPAYFQGRAAPAAAPDPVFRWQEATSRQTSGNKRARLLLVAVIALLAVYFVLPQGDKGKIKPEPVAKPQAVVNLPPNMPKEYLELTPELQRTIEGYYKSAITAGKTENYEEALTDLKKIHDLLPFYKESREMSDAFTKRVKEKQIGEAQDKAKRDEKQDLALYLEEGMEYLKEGDFERAAEAFNSAIVIDPANDTAIKGLKAAEFKVRSFDEIPAPKDPELEKRKTVADLFQKAVTAFTNKSYQEAIDTAEKIRLVELKGDTQYLNEAKQIIDRARMLQKEEFEPFLIQAKEKYAEGDYNASRDLCDEMLKRDGAYEEAKECVLKAKKQLNRLAKEAYTHGYILESMNRIEEAKQYWNRAKNYVRSGDDYYDKVNKKLDSYQ